jgi:hypothetical protein
VIGQALSSLGKGLVPAFIAMARQLGVPLPAELSDPEAALAPGRFVGVLRDIAGHFFPLLTRQGVNEREEGHASRRPSLRDCMTAWLRPETPSLR